MFGKIRVAVTYLFVFLFVFGLFGTALATTDVPPATQPATQPVTQPVTQPTPVVPAGSSNPFTQYEIEELGVVVPIPSDWTTVTLKTEQDDPALKVFNYAGYDEFLDYMKSDGRHKYIHSIDTADDNQPEIFITTYAVEKTDNYTEWEFFDWDFKLYAKMSYDDLVDQNEKKKANGESYCNYTGYEIYKHKQLNYIVFSYEETDDAGNQIYGLYYHTIINNKVFQIDFIALNELTDEYITLLETIAEGCTFTIDNNHGYTRKVRVTLTIVALCALFVALVVVITVYIVGKVKEKNVLDEARREARKQAAQQEAFKQGNANAGEQKKE